MIKLEILRIEDEQEDGKVFDEFLDYLKMIKCLMYRMLPNAY